MFKTNFRSIFIQLRRVHKWAMEISFQGLAKIGASSAKTRNQASGIQRQRYASSLQLLLEKDRTKPDDHHPHSNAPATWSAKKSQIDAVLRIDRPYRRRKTAAKKLCAIFYGMGGFAKVAALEITCCVTQGSKLT